MPPDGAQIDAPNGTAPAASSQSSGTEARPGASASATDSPPATPASTEPSEQPAGRNDWFRESFNRVRFRLPTTPPEAAASPEQKSESDAGGDAQTTVPPSAEGGSKPERTDADASKNEGKGEDTVTLTQAELQRRIQAETDRILAKHQREEAERRKREEKKRVRDTDPYKFAELEREEEQKAEALQKELEQAHKLTKSAMEAYDATVLNPLMSLLPDPEIKRILDAIDTGIPGRGQAANQALKYLEQKWKQAGVESARKALLNDQSFVKEVLAKYGGGRIEPDLVPAAAAPARQPFAMTSWIREEGNRVRGR